MFNIIPLVGRAIKHGNVIAQILCDEIHMRCLQSDLAIGYELVSRSNSSRGEQLAYIVESQKNRFLWLLHSLFPKNVIGPGKMSCNIAFLWPRVDKNHMGTRLRC